MMGDSPDYYDMSSRRQTFAHWDQPFIEWLEANDYRVDFCTDLDVHQDEAMLLPYNLMLSVGHDEYWSSEMRAHIDQFVQAGGNVAYFSGNIDGWRIHFQDGDTAISCAKVAPPGSSNSTASVTARTAPNTWVHDSNQATEPENSTTGVSYYLAGGWWDGKRETLGYTVQHAEHWIFAATGLKDGDVFGADDDLPLIGYECDGADFQVRDGYAYPTGMQGTPRSFFILGLARLGPGWRTFRSDDTATMGVYTSTAGGIVFQGATTDWPKVAPKNRHVAQITRNVIDQLSLQSARVLGPLPGKSGRLLAERGAVVTFLVDTSRLQAVEGLTYSWRVSDHDPKTTTEPRLEVVVPEELSAVTITVDISDQSGRIAFGTSTFTPLSHVDALRLEIITLLREMVTPGDPSGSFVVATSDPLLVSRGIATINLPSILERSKRLSEVARELLDIWSRDGSRPVVADPRRR